MDFLGKNEEINEQNQFNGYSKLPTIALAALGGFMASGLLIGFGCSVYHGSKNKAILQQSYQSIPQEIKKYDFYPKDGCLDASELERLLEDFEFVKK